MFKKTVQFISMASLILFFNPDSNAGKMDKCPGWPGFHGQQTVSDFLTSDVFDGKDGFNYRFRVLDIEGDMLQALGKVENANPEVYGINLLPSALEEDGCQYTLRIYYKGTIFSHNRKFKLKMMREQQEKIKKKFNVGPIGVIFQSIWTDLKPFIINTVLPSLTESIENTISEKIQSLVDADLPAIEKEKTTIPVIKMVQLILHKLDEDKYREEEKPKLVIEDKSSITKTLINEKEPSSDMQGIIEIKENTAPVEEIKEEKPKNEKGEDN